MKPPGFSLPKPEHVNITENLWRVVSTSYNFGGLGLSVPGNAIYCLLILILGMDRIHLENIIIIDDKNDVLVFNSKPTILALSLNNKSMTFHPESGITIRFEHQNNSLVRRLLS